MIDLSLLKAYDCETFLIEPGNLTPRLVCASVADGREGSERVGDRAAAKRTFLGCIAGKGVLGGANIAFDLGVAAAEWPEVLDAIFKALEEGRVVDTHLLEALHDNARGCLFKDPATGAPFRRYNLLMLEQRYLDKDRSADKHGENAWRLRYRELAEVPLDQWPNEALQYPRDDARGTFDVLARQLAPAVEGVSPSPEPRHNVQMIHQEAQAAFALHLMSVWGMRTDPEMVAKVVGDIEREHVESRQKFLAAGLVKLRKARGGAEPEIPDVPPDSECPRGYMYQADTAVLRARVETAYQGNPPLTDGGESGDRKISTARETLESSGDPLLEEYGEAGPNEKLFSTYCDILRQGTAVPINTSYSVIQATDRTSSSNPNVQNLPRKSWVRYCFAPRPWGPLARDRTVLCSVDYNGVELVTLAQIVYWMFGHSAMRDAINAGQDLHSRLAGDILRISYDEAIKLKKAGDPKFKGMRQVCKPTNFGTGGGMAPPKQVLAARKDGVKYCEASGVLEVCGSRGKVTEYQPSPYSQPYAIAPTCVVCLELGIEFKQAYLNTWVEMPEYFKAIGMLAEECARGVPVEALSKGHMLRLDPNFCALSNFGFQNLAAVGAKDALWRLSKECYTDRKSVLFNNARPVTFIHDEVIMEVREEFAHECALRQTEIMVSTMQEHCPDVKVAAEPALMRRWFKNAELAKDKAGRLRPWWPKDWAWPLDQKQMQADNEA